MGALVKGPSGVVIEVDEQLAISLIDGGYVVEVPPGSAEVGDIVLDEGADVGESTGIDGAPRGNASLADWITYAESLGIEIPADAKRDDIKALVAAHTETAQA